MPRYLKHLSCNGFSPHHASSPALFLRLPMVISLIAIAGCTHASTTTTVESDGRSPKERIQREPSPVNNEEMTAISATAIASQILNENGVSYEQCQINARQNDDGWHIEFLRIPRRPGGHAIVLLDRSGNLLRLINGR